MGDDIPAPGEALITQTVKKVISEKQVLSHVLMIRHRHQVPHPEIFVKEEAEQV